MNIIIPMAGIGKRLRPHTLTTPKPLLPIAGKPIVHRLVEDIAAVCEEKIETIGFIIHPSFGKPVEADLIRVAESVGAKGKIFYQESALGISHALLFAKEIITGKVIIAFADTLFKTDFKLDTTRDGIIWVQEVADPSQFGVVKINSEGEIEALIEKPSEPVSNLAIIGIYFFKDGEFLKREMQYLIDHDIKEKGEYQFTTALENMNKKGVKFIPAQVDEWLDCGNKDAMINTNQRYLEFIRDQSLVSKTAKLINTTIVPPVFIGENVSIANSIIGPHVSVGAYTNISDAKLENSIILQNCSIQNAVLSNGMLGNFVNFEGKSEDLSLGDFSYIKLAP